MTAKESAHLPVLLEQTVQSLRPKPGGRYVDCTLGAGGHTKFLIEQCRGDAQVIAFDRDLSAIALAKERLGDLASRVTFIHEPFSRLHEELSERGVDRVDGILADLGVSSMQLNTAERGFSFARGGPIDMRMDPSRGISALDYILQSDPVDLADTIFKLGEERFSRRIAATIHEAAQKDELKNTTDLANLVAECIPSRAKRQMRIHPATRTFQALRIAINGELNELDVFLSNFVEKLEFGGRCAIISFHSLEDRMVKHSFRALAKSSSLPPKYAIEAGERPSPLCHLVTRKAIVASPEEVESNPRSRSAKLRVCERASEQ